MVSFELVRLRIWDTWSSKGSELIAPKVAVVAIKQVSIANENFFPIATEQPKPLKVFNGILRLEQIIL
jgi:hypothetical protein